MLHPAPAAGAAAGAEGFLGPPVTRHAMLVRSRKQCSSRLSTTRYSLSSSSTFAAQQRRSLSDACAASTLLSHLLLQGTSPPYDGVLAACCCLAKHNEARIPLRLTLQVAASSGTRCTAVNASCGALLV